MFNRTRIAPALSRIFMDDEKGGEGGGGGGGTTVTPDVARTFLTNFVSDPEGLKTMKDEDVMTFHGKVSAFQQKAIDEAVAKAKQEGAPKAPEKYELKLPKDSLLDPKEIDGISAYAKEKGLSNEQAQAIVEQRNEAVAAFSTRMSEKHKADVAGWRKSVETDKEIGGDKLAETQMLSNLVIDKFMPPELRQLLKTTGYGEHPAVVKFVRTIGLAMAEDGNHGGGSRKISAEDRKDPASVLYNKTPGEG